MTGASGRAVGGKGMLKALKKGPSEGGDSGALGLDRAQGRRGLWEDG